MPTEVVIPQIARDRGSCRQRQQLDGIEFELTFQFNQREARWTLDVADVDGTTIVAGIALVPFWDLLWRVTDERRPPGKLMLASAISRDPPGLTELGTSSTLLYYDLAEITG